jgi:hypothetical protein
MSLIHHIDEKNPVKTIPTNDNLLPSDARQQSHQTLLAVFRKIVHLGLVGLLCWGIWNEWGPEPVVWNKGKSGMDTGRCPVQPSVIGKGPGMVSFDERTVDLVLDINLS